MAENAVLFEKQEQVAIVTLNRPEVHNAINAEMMAQLEEILDAIENDAEILVVILTAAGNESFCAGGDLKYFAGLRTREDALRMSRRMQAILNRFYQGERVVIAAVNGRALGGGCEILTACHFRSAAENAQFAFRQAANGITTGWGGGVRLFEQIGRSAALQLLLTSETIDANAAKEISFVQQVVPANQLLPAALALAERISENPADAVRAFIHLAREFPHRSRNELIKLETETFGDLWVGKDFREWLKRFLGES